VSSLTGEDTQRTAVPLQLPGCRKDGHTAMVQYVCEFAEGGRRHFEASVSATVW